MKIILLIVLLLFANACSQIKFAVVNAPVHGFDGTITKDIKYGELSSQTLDIYQPADANKTYPVVIFIHGGRWTFGDKSQYQFVGMMLANMGYVVAVPNTRLYPEVKFPSFVEDAALSVAWVHDNVAKYSGNENLFITGHSSGAHIGAMLVADERYLAALDLDVDIINAFAGMSGPYDFEPRTEDLKDMFGPPENYPNMVATNFIDGSEPPILLIYTQNDATVHIANLEKFKKGIEKANGRVESIIYESGGHAAPVAAFSWVNPSDIPVPRDIDTFFRKNMNK